MLTAQRASLLKVLEGLGEWVTGSVQPDLPEPLQSFIIDAIGLREEPARNDLAAYAAYEEDVEKVRRRAIVDYFCTLTDQGCIRLSRLFAGTELTQV